MPISYDNAFGGLDNFHEDKNKHSAYMLNPVGKGYHQLIGRLSRRQYPRCPNTEEVSRPIQTPNDNYQTYGLRAGGPRLVATPAIRRHLRPGLDRQYLSISYLQILTRLITRPHQLDQQIPYLKGGEEVVLVNL